MRLWVVGLSLLALLQAARASCVCDPDLTDMEKLCMAEVVVRTQITSDFMTIDLGGTTFGCYHTTNSAFYVTMPGADWSRGFGAIVSPDTDCGMAQDWERGTYVVAGIIDGNGLLVVDQCQGIVIPWTAFVEELGPSRGPSAVAQYLEELCSEY